MSYYLLFPCSFANKSNKSVIDHWTLLLITNWGSDDHSLYFPPRTSPFMFLFRHNVTIPTRVRSKVEVRAWRQHNARDWPVPSLLIRLLVLSHSLWRINHQLTIHSRSEIASIIVIHWFCARYQDKKQFQRSTMFIVPRPSRDTTTKIPWLCARAINFSGHFVAWKLAISVWRNFFCLHFC